MNEPGPRPPDTIPIDLAQWMEESDDATLALLVSVGDAQGLGCQFEPTADDTVGIFNSWWPDVRITEALAKLLTCGLIEAGPRGTYVWPVRLQTRLESALTGRYAEDSDYFQKIVQGFTNYLQEAQPEVVPANPSSELWNTQTYLTGRRRHHFIYRPFPFMFQPPPEDYLLVLSEYPETVMEKIIQNFVAEASRRKRLAIYDLERTHKINLTHSEVAVHFERYLNRVHGLRIRPAPGLNRALADEAILNLEMG